MGDNPFYNTLLSMLDFRKCQLLPSESQISPKRVYSSWKSITLGRCHCNLNTNTNSGGCYSLREALFWTYILQYFLHHHCREGLCCFQSLKNLHFTAAKEMTREEKHRQCLSAINSIYNCPAVCTQRNQPVSSRTFCHWKLIRHFQRRGLSVTR